MMEPVFFAAVGDVHGQFFLTRKLLQRLEREVLGGSRLDFVLQVGDIECHRHEGDMASMAAPASKRLMGDFTPCCLSTSESEQLSWPWPTYFIGGNHECYGWLDAPGRPGGPLAVAPNMTYLGRAGYLPIRVPQKGGALIHVGFISGIHIEASFFHRRPVASAERFAVKSNKAWIGFNCYDTNNLLWDEEDSGVEKGPDAIEKAAAWAPDADDSLTFREQLELRVRRVLQLDPQLGADFMLGRGEVRFLLRFVLAADAPSGSGLSAWPAAEKIDVAERKLLHGIRPWAEGGVTDDGVACPLSTFLDYFSSERMLSSQLFSGARQRKFLDKFLCRRCCDVLVSHDWPAGIFRPPDVQRLEGLRGSRPMGNPVVRELVDTVRPKLLVCGHMHRPYRATIRHEDSEGLSTAVCCCSKVGMPLSLALFRFDPRTAEIVEMGAPAEADLLQHLSSNAQEDEASSDEDADE